MESCVKPPVLLNGWKHHLGYVYGKISDIVANQESPEENINKILNQIGRSQFDLYTGKYSESKIRDKILEEIPKMDKLEYFSWLEGGNKRFKNISIDDDSSWTMLKGNSSSYYIHVHPARHSPYSIRVKANQWKSAIISLIYSKMDVKKACQPDVINKSRQSFAGLESIHEKFDHKIIDLIKFIMEEGEKVRG